MIDFKVEEADNITTLTINGELSIENAAALQGIFIESLERASHLKINLENIANVDLSFLQLLSSVQKTSEHLNTKVTLTGRCPEIFREAVVNSGFLREGGCTFNSNNECKCADRGDNQ